MRTGKLVEVSVNNIVNNRNFTILVAVECKEFESHMLGAVADTALAFIESSGSLATSELKGVKVIGEIQMMSYVSPENSISTLSEVCCCAFNDIDAYKKYSVQDLLARIRELVKLEECSKTTQTET